MKTLLLILTAIIITSCSLSPKTITNAVVGHAQFPTLSMAVQDCVSDHPEVRAQIISPFNVLVSKWQAADDLEPDATLVAVLAGAKMEVQEAKVAWVTIKSAIVDAGIDCGPAVKQQVANIETTFTEIETAILNNERAVYALEWGQLLASVALGRRGEVVRMQ